MSFRLGSKCDVDERFDGERNPIEQVVKHDAERYAEQKARADGYGSPNFLAEEGFHGCD